MGENGRRELAPAVDALLDALAELVAAKVVAKLGAPADHYTTRAAGLQPPGKSRAWALRTLKTIPGARKVGRDWVIAVSDYEAWLTERDTARVTGSRATAQDVEALAEAALRERGYRPSRVTRSSSGTETRRRRI